MRPSERALLSTTRSTRTFGSLRAPRPVNANGGRHREAFHSYSSTVTDVFRPCLTKYGKKPQSVYRCRW